MSLSDAKTIVDYGIAQRAYIHPWMHLVECDIRCKDIDNFYAPLLEYVLLCQADGTLANASYSALTARLVEETPVDNHEV